MGWGWILVATGQARLTMKAILPGKFNSDVFREEFTKASNDMTKRTEREFRKTHQTWNEQRPTWRKDVRVDFTAITWTVETSHLIYFFLNNGTRVRYAAMTPGFQPKTRVRYIGSSPGFGGFSHLRFVPPPGPNGIEGRFWDEEIAKKMTPIMFKRFESAMKAGARRSGHGI